MSLVIVGSDVGAALFSFSGVAFDSHRIQFWHVTLARLVSFMTRPEF